MKRTHDRGRKAAHVAEPVQVYLAPPDRQRLDRLAARLDATKSAVLRQGLEALERQLTDPDQHPVLRIIGIADGPDIGPPVDYDIAVEHDRYLAEIEDARAAEWLKAAKPAARRKRGRGA